MKIAMVAEQVPVRSLAQALADRGHRVTIYTRQGTPVAATPTGPGVTVVALPGGAGPDSGAHPEGDAGPGPEPDAGLDATLDAGLANLPDFAAALRQRWAVDRPDVVHAHFWTAGLAAIAGARDAGIPVLQTFHTLGSADPARAEAGDPTQRIRLEAAIGRSVTQVLAGSRAEVEEHLRRGLPRSAVTVLPYGVDVQRFSPDGPVATRNNRPRVVSAGPLVPRTGFDLAIRALRRVPRAELLIIGEPGQPRLRTDPEARRLLAEADRSGVAERVSVTCGVSDDELPALLRSADVAVCTPWSEPVGGAALQAMACGVPVVAAALGELIDTVAEGATGVLVPPRQPVALATAVRRLLADPTRLAGYRVGAVDRARARFAWAAVALDTEAAYRRALRLPPPD
jgi:glycosyltransferase involved in cell wall biosynthesis